jgi:hypothetical protein
MCAVVTVIIGSVQFSETVIIIVLKSVTRKRIVKTGDFYICCGHSDI